jgi:hypothetical protein
MDAPAGLMRAGRTLRLVLAAAGAALAAAAPAAAVEGFPGAVWGNATHDHGGPYGNGTMGWVRQGVDWTTLPGRIKLTTFAAYSFRVRSKERLYYNTDGPSVGLELRRAPFTLGADYYRESFRELDRVSQNREVYLSWYVRLRRRTAFPVSSWGKLVRDTSALTGSSAMGWVKLNAERDVPGGARGRIFGEYRYRGRTRERQYFDARGPAVGVELEKGPFTLGFGHMWETLPFRDGHLEKNEVYLGWYHSWDLRRRT